MRYCVRITDPTTNRHCDVYVAGDRDLETLLLFLKCATGLAYEVRDLKKESSGSEAL
jgi:hypothetical protein